MTIYVSHYFSYSLYIYIVVLLNSLPYVHIPVSSITRALHKRPPVVCLLLLLRCTFHIDFQAFFLKKTPHVLYFFCPRNRCQGTSFQHYTRKASVSVMSVFRTVRATAAARTQNGSRCESRKRIRVLRESLHTQISIRPPWAERRLKCFRPFVGRKSHVSYFVHRTRSTLYILPPTLSYVYPGACLAFSQRRVADTRR